MRAPSRPREYPERSAITPPTRMEIQTALPATWPACPSSAKIPAPTMAPIPMATADQNKTDFPDLCISSASVCCQVGGRDGPSRCVSDGLDNVTVCRAGFSLRRLTRMATPGVVLTREPGVVVQVSGQRTSRRAPRCPWPPRPAVPRFTRGFGPGAVPGRRLPRLLRGHVALRSGSRPRVSRRPQRGVRAHPRPAACGTGWRPSTGSTRHSR